jgi:SIR2-like domain/TIR domain
MDAAPGDGQAEKASMSPPWLRVFINYRHEDTWGEAQLLYDRLANRFGSENVFLDTRNLQPGMKWLEEIKSHRASCDVLLSLIGPRWMSIMKTRAQAAVVQPTEDYVRFEIEYALRRDSGIYVIPVLVGDGVLFTAGTLPRSLQVLTTIEVEQVRPKRFEEDLAHLIGRLETFAREQPAPTPQPTAARRTEVRHPAPVPDSAKAFVPQPDAAHCELVLRHMVKEGDLVTFLGSRLVGGNVGPLEGSRSLPGAKEIAADLAERFGVKSTRLDLPEVAQYVYVTKGRPDLYRTVRQIITADCEPGPAHRFLARLPRTLEELRLEKRYQLIVSTNFDTALEQAFREEEEPYDLVIYMASGDHKGKFVHFPYEADAEPIAVPNSYGKFPIGDYGELERTVIVKIHGAVDGNVGDYRWKENYVITEDHYIDYLSRGPIESLVPVQVLDKLRDSHCLFLGYAVRDWNLRVFLKRIWRGEPLGAKSWAVEPDPDLLEKEFWAQFYVDLYAADLADYVDMLQERLTGRM